ILLNTNIYTLSLHDALPILKNSRILIIGVSYKKDIDDLRESPALDVIQLLQNRGAKVMYHDPHVPKIRLDSTAILQQLDHVQCRSEEHTSELQSRFDLVCRL